MAPDAPLKGSLLSSYLNLNKLKFDACLEEPAKNIFKKKFKKINFVNKKNILRNIKQYDEALIGTGVKYFEAEILNKIKNKIKTKSFIDHWCFFKDRFKLKDNGSVFPDKIIAHDKYSFIKLKKKFPHTKIILLHNPFWIEQTKKYKKDKLTKKKSILILCSSLKEDDFKPILINSFLKKIKKKNFSGNITLRPHPLDIHKNFIKIFPYLKNFNHEISKKNEIGKDIDKACFVVGFKTSSLVLSKKFKKKTFSFHKKKLLKISVPHIHIDYIEKIFKFI